MEYCRTACDVGQCGRWCKECPAPEVIPEAIPGVLAYGAVHTQWRRAGTRGARAGLDYTACMPVLRLLLARWERDGWELGITEEELLEDLQSMESAILEVDMERAEQRHGSGA